MRPPTRGHERDGSEGKGVFEGQDPAARAMGSGKRWPIVALGEVIARRTEGQTETGRALFEMEILRGGVRGVDEANGACIVKLPHKDGAFQERASGSAKGRRWFYGASGDYAEEELKSQGASGSRGRNSVKGEGGCDGSSRSLEGDHDNRRPVVGTDGVGKAEIFDSRRPVYP
ncbi:hypothetical protein KM043_008913 [Ampulex compressa]|nr:hypothetical protein KM043_008913 [Ampulex compressa]